MAKAKTAKEKTETNLVAGRFRPDSFKAALFNALKDGKNHTMEDLKKVKELKGCKNLPARLRVIEANGVKLQRKDGAVKFLGLGPRKAA